MSRFRQECPDFAECAYVLSFWTYQENLLQTYRQFNFTFQSIVVAIAASVTTLGVSARDYSEWSRTTFIVGCMYLFSAQFGRVMQIQIDKRGDHVTYWQILLRRVEEQLPTENQHYLEWLGRRPFEQHERHGFWSLLHLNPFDKRSTKARNSIGSITKSCIDPIWVALFVLLFVRLRFLASEDPVQIYNINSAQLGEPTSYLVIFLAGIWGCHCLLRWLAHIMGPDPGHTWKVFLWGPNYAKTDQTESKSTNGKAVATPATRGGDAPP